MAVITVAGSLLAFTTGGGEVRKDAKTLAARIKDGVGVPCIESWLTEVGKTRPIVSGGTSVDSSQWPGCVREVRLDRRPALRTERVILNEDRSATLYLGPLWRMTVGRLAAPGPRRWPIAGTAYLWYVER